MTPAIRATGTPFVALAPGNGGNDLLSVSTNDREICAEMTRYLAELGHRRIAFIAGNADHKAVRNRFLGYKDGLGDSEGEIAPTIEADAADVCAAKKNVRVLETGPWSGAAAGGFDFKKVSGGLLVQTSDLGVITADDLKVVTEKAPGPQQIQDMLFAWTVVKYVKSNAIIFCKDNMTIGVGAGQMSRVYSTKIAALKAADEGLEVSGSVMASDAFFPFRDGIDAAAETGISAIIQPGGSMRDDEVIEAANEHGLAMVFTGMRHFRH